MQGDILYNLGTIPFDLAVLQSLYPRCSNIADKARRMEDAGDIIRLKRGLYVANRTDGILSRELIANHIYGPSYVSINWALSHYGLIPERVLRIESVTTKHTRSFDTPLGTFFYQNCSPEYFPIGIKSEEKNGIHYLIASPEKALCDYICFHKVPLRSRRETGIFLEEDLRFDTDVLADLNIEILTRCAETGRSTGSLSVLLNYIQHERRL